MLDGWTILHSGALGDLILTLQLALRLPGVRESGRLHAFSRIDPGDLSSCRPRITRRSAEGLDLHWLFGDHDNPPPDQLRAAIAGRHVLSALAGTHTIVHHRLQELEPAALYSIDPRPRDGVERHITQQWQTQLEAQGLLLPKCIHQRPDQRTLGVPDTLRDRGRARLDIAGCKHESMLMHPGSGGEPKRWPLKCFLELARVVNSGPAHLAAILGTPTIAIFGTTSPQVWHPLGASVQTIAGDPTISNNWGLDPAQVADAASKHAREPTNAEHA
jgi:hypothetical protein